MKISIIGTGNVGSTIAYALVLKGLCSHLTLANRNMTKAQGDAMDLQHTLTFCQRAMQIVCKPIDQVSDSDIVIVAASVSLGQEMTKRMELGPGNVRLFRELIPTLANNNPEAVFIIVSNPVDVLTYLTHQITALGAEKIIGIGTLVDSARFRAMLSVKEKIHPDDLRTYILGEHGPTQFPVFSNASTGGEQILDTPEHRKIFQEVSGAGFDVLRLKGYTNFAIATATSEVIQSIVYDDHRTMPLSTYFKEWQSIKDNCFSIPIVVGRSGVIRHLHPTLNDTEKAALAETAKIVKAHIRQLLVTDNNA